MKHLGNMTVTPENAHSFPAVDEIYGHLTITANTDLRATKLVMVRGWITVQFGATLTAPMLGLVDGWLTVEGQISALHLTDVRADLSMAVSSIVDLPALATVGAINLARGAKKNLIAVHEVRGNVTLMADADLQAPLLERIGKSLTLRAGARFDAPLLNHIGGYADIDETAGVHAPRFIS